MATLLLRLAAPLQSWGNDSKFDTRMTENEPTKSGVIGLLAAALGRRRDESIDDLAGLKFGVRVDKEGILLRDFHTAKSMKRVCFTSKYLSKGGCNEEVDKLYVTNRYYLCDAVFLAGFESEDNRLLENIERALKNPVFPLFLGRRSCPPTLPLCLGIRNKSLEEALKTEERLTEDKSGKGQLRIQMDDERGNIMSRRKDVPLSFNPEYRQYGYRIVREGYVNMTADKETEHDAMAELED